MWKILKEIFQIQDIWLVGHYSSLHPRLSPRLHTRVNAMVSPKVDTWVEPRADRKDKVGSWK